MRYLQFEIDGDHLELRDIVDEDINLFVSYWHDGGADLEFLGIDRAKLGSRADTTERFRGYINQHAGPQPAVGFTFARNGAAVGYANINAHGRKQGYVHVHVTDASARKQGLVTAFLIGSLPVIASLILPQLAVDSLVLETRTRNVGINRVVENAGLRPVRSGYLANPDGVAGPGEFNIYILDQQTLQALISSKDGVAS